MNYEQFPNASLLRRLAALFYDLLLLTAVLLFVSAVAVTTNNGEASTKNWFFFCTVGTTYLFFSWFWVHGGQTLGMQAWKIRLISNKTERLNWKIASKRFFWGLLSAGTLGISYLWMLTKEKLPLYDVFAQTRVVFLAPNRKNH